MIQSVGYSSVLMTVCDPGSAGGVRAAFFSRLSADSVRVLLWWCAGHLVLNHRPQIIGCFVNAPASLPPLSLLSHRESAPHHTHSSLALSVDASAAVIVVVIYI
jgi:hypothetical protein